MARTFAYPSCQKLKRAVERNDLELAQAILSSENWLLCGIVDIFDDPCSYLYIATRDGFVAMAKLLIDAKANVNQQFFEGKTPLIIAATNGPTEMVQLFLEQPEIIVNLYDDLRLTPLHYARTNNRKRITKLLLDHNATVASETKSLTPRIQLLKVYFFFLPKKKNQTFLNVFMYILFVQQLEVAVIGNDAQSVQSILNQDRWLVNRIIREYRSTRFNSFLCIAVDRGYFQVAKVLLDAKASVNQLCDKGRGPLCLAALKGHEKIARLLLAQPEIVVDMLDDSRTTPLMLASSKCFAPIVRQLLDAKANVNGVDDHGGTSLSWAVTSGCDTSVVQLLVQPNADVSHRTGMGDFRLEDTLVALLEAKALVDITNPKGETALYVAARKGHSATVRRLLAAGANPNHHTINLETPLRAAARLGCDAVVDELLKGGADPNLVDSSNGESPLHIIAYHRVSTCIPSLLKAKADIDLADNDGHTPLIVAARYSATTQLFCCATVPIC